MRYVNVILNFLRDWFREPELPPPDPLRLKEPPIDVVQKIADGLFRSLSLGPGSSCSIKDSAENGKTIVLEITSDYSALVATIEVLAENQVVWVSSFEGTENMAEKLTTALHRQAREWHLRTLRVVACGAQLF
jgi:hypothetical protein